MKPYLAFFRVRFSNGLQYRAAALAGMTTQVAWGFMIIFMFRAFYQADPSAFPMTFQGLSSYIWLQQAFLTLFTTWFVEKVIFECISTGQVAYEMCRPMNLYAMWWTRSAANRLSRAVLRCVPVLTVALLLPAPYGLLLPSKGETYLLFFLSMILGFGVVVSMELLLYGVNFYTVSPRGVRSLVSAVAYFLAGGTVPLAFFPGWLRKILDFLPFSAMQNAPFEIFAGSISGAGAWNTVGRQLFWLAALVLLGRWLFQKGTRRVVVQGG